MNKGSLDRRDAFERKLHRFVSTEAERALLQSFSSVRRRIAPGEELASADRPSKIAYLLHEGWACAYKVLPDGSRHIIDFRLPGDFLGLVGILMGKQEYDVTALSNVVVSEVNTSRLISTFRESPLLAEGILWSLSRDIAIMAEHLVNIGRRDALARTVHLLIELGYRLNQVQGSDPTTYEFPITQKDLAEALGITHVHMNRVLRYLRNQRLLSFNGNTIVLNDMPTLMRIADFEPGYLDSR
jgi:CRP-like cAMP-binding protein